MMYERLITAELADRLSSYPFYSQEGKQIDEHIVLAVFALGRIKYYVFEGQKEGDDYIVFCLAVGFSDGPEFTYASCNEMADVSVDLSCIDQSMSDVRFVSFEGWEPCQLKDIADEDIKAYINKMNCDYANSEK